MTRVVDASVVLAWYIREEGSDAAGRYQGMPLVAPGLMWIEIANALATKVRRDSMDPLQGAATLAAVETDVERVPEKASIARAFEIACELKHPVYDCVYLALAESLGTVVVTADRRLALACRGTGYAELIEPA